MGTNLYDIIVGGILLLGVYTIYPIGKTFAAAKIEEMVSATRERFQARKLAEVRFAHELAGAEEKQIFELNSARELREELHKRNIVDAQLKTKMAEAQVMFVGVMLDKAKETNDANLLRALASGQPISQTAPSPK